MIPTWYELLVKGLPVKHLSTHVSPAVILGIDIDCLQIVATGCVGTVCTVGGIGRVDHVSSTHRQEICNVLSAGTIRWQRYVCELTLFANNCGTPGHGRQQRTNEIRERIEVVEPVAPETLDLIIRNDYTAEENQAAANEQGIEQCSEVRSRAICCNSL